MPKGKDRHPIVAVFAKNLRGHRKRYDISQEEFARRVGIDRSYYSGLERGVRNPTITVVAELARALGVHAYELLDPNP